MDIEIGKTGYVHVLNTKGHYIISAGGKRDGELIIDAKDADGVEFIKEMISNAKSKNLRHILKSVHNYLKRKVEFLR